MIRNIKRSSHYSSEEDAQIVTNQILFGDHQTGERVKEFEKEMSEFIDTKYAKATTSGTTALHTALLSLDIKKGDEIVIPTYVCQSVMNAVNYTHSTPILADIDNNFETKGYNISLDTIKPKINSNTKAIILPHMFGIPSDFDEIKKLKIPIIEDCAHSIGARYNEKLAGSLGEASIFSFYATKMISTGQGGMVLTSSRKIKNRLDDLTQYDGRNEYKVSYNYGMSDIQAALGISQLQQLPLFLKRRNKIADIYNSAFSQTSLNLPPKINGGIQYRYIVRTNSASKKETLQKKLRDHWIEAERPVFKPLHRYIDLDPTKFPNAELVYDTALTIPLYPALTDEEVDYIVSTVVKCLK
jgi:perosamine synthetase